MAPNWREVIEGKAEILIPLEERTDSLSQESIEAHNSPHSSLEEEQGVASTSQLSLEDKTYIDLHAKGYTI